jgi:5-oxoprolinase (ATP-hydrolysing)
LAGGTPQRYLGEFESGCDLPHDLRQRCEAGNWVVNRGFADALRIGNQTRPRLFDLDIRLPSMLYERVVEIGGRVGIDGSEIETLDEAGRAFSEAHAAGISACAIVLVHAWKFPEHERRLAGPPCSMVKQAG